MIRSLVDDDRRRAEQPIGEDDVGVSEQDHGRRSASAVCVLRAAAPPRRRARNTVAIRLVEQLAEAALVRRREHDHPGTLGRRKRPVVGVVAIERHEGAPELARQAVVLDVPRPPQVVVLEDEQYVPPEAHAHELDDPVREVGVGVDARPLDQSRDVRAKLG